MKKIILLVNDDSSIAGTCGALQIFNIANLLWNIENPGKDPVFECSVVASVKNHIMPCKGLRFELTKGMHPYEQADAVITTGFIYQNVKNLLEKTHKAMTAIDWIRRQYDQGAVIGASCTGTVLLAETKLLDGKTATTSWWLEDLFRRRYPRIKLQIDRLIVKNGRLITAGAVTSYTNLVLSLIEKFGGKDLALTCSKMMLIDINKFSQGPFIMMKTLPEHSDDMVKKAQYWINEHLQRKFDLHELSDYLAVSYRTLIRRFKSVTGDTPTRYLQKMRIEAAKRLLETTDLTLETIVERVGYLDTSSFSLLFKRLTRLTPREYRLQFSINHRQAT